MIRSRPKYLQIRKTSTGKQWRNFCWELDFCLPESQRLALRPIQDWDFFFFNFISKVGRLLYVLCADNKVKPAHFTSCPAVNQAVTFLFVCRHLFPEVPVPHTL
jgi:hypothetical protein